MAVSVQTPVEATAEIELWVSRGEMGDLPSGVRAVVEDIDAIETAEVVNVSDVRPRTTDICVTATVWMVVETTPNDPDDLVATLEDGFGVMDVEMLVFDQPAHA